jgi:hypothetical protein
MNRRLDGAAREWLLVGRDDQVGAIEAGYRQQDLHGLMLTGTRGVGKSRVAREAAARLGTGGCRVVWVGARRAPCSMPFGAIAHLAPGADNGFVLLSRLISNLRASRLDRTVVVVDDAHMLDDESAAVLAELAVQRLVFLIGTVAPGGREPGASTAS